MLTSWIRFGDTWEPYQIGYSFNIGIQISHKKKVEYPFEKNEFFSSENNNLNSLFRKNLFRLTWKIVGYLL